jgi:hypothetical protein
MRNRRIVLALALLAVLSGGVGCQNVSNPFSRRDTDKSGRDILTNPDLEEQQKFGRSRYSYIEDDKGIAPPTYMGRPNPSGR